MNLSTGIQDDERDSSTVFSYNWVSNEKTQLQIRIIINPYQVKTTIIENHKILSETTATR